MGSVVFSSLHLPRLISEIWEFKSSTKSVQNWCHEANAAFFLLCRRRTQSWMPWLTRPVWRRRSSTLCQGSSVIQSRGPCTPFLRSIFHHKLLRKPRSAPKCAAAFTCIRLVLSYLFISNSVFILSLFVSQQCTGKISHPWNSLLTRAYWHSN